jgi:glycosyltransferase involved in cell wall biosynthesis
MRALWLIRRSLENQLGGDTIQVLRTADALRTIGVEVDMAAAPGRDVDEYDVVHLFHLDRVWENVHHCQMLRDSDVPVVLTPIFWVSDEFDRKGRALPQRMLARSLGGSTLRNVRLAYQWADQLMRSPRSVAETRPVLGFQRNARRVLERVNMLLPASRSELLAVEKATGMQVPSMVVHGAADNSIFHSRGAPAHRRGVLCAGRIEPRKNQLALIRAMRDLDLDEPLTIVGRPGPTAAAYERQCRREGGDRVRFISGLSQEEVADEYRRTKVHASVSWYETPGLVNLEAALCRCALVATRGGTTGDYLGRDAHYCNPVDYASIQRAVEAALESGPSEALHRRVHTEFTWEEAAQRTLDAYRWVAGRDEDAERQPAPSRGRIRYTHGLPSLGRAP